MTTGEWIGWSAVALGFLGMLTFCWAIGSDLDDLRGRLDLLEEQRGELQADLSEGFDVIHSRVDSLPFGERTDTVEAMAVPGRQFHGSTAYGRHAAREAA